MPRLTTESGASPAGADAGRRSGKRDRLLAAVYYYFKTKDDIIAAVLDAHIKASEQEIGSLERHRTPAA